MASYLIEPHKLRLDYDASLEAAINYACENGLTIPLWPVGEIIPHSCRRVREELDVTAIGETSQKWLVMDELEVGW